MPLRIERRTFEKATIAGLTAATDGASTSQDSSTQPYTDEDPYQGDDEEVPVGAFAISMSRSRRTNRQTRRARRREIFGDEASIRGGDSPSMTTQSGADSPGRVDSPEETNEEQTGGGKNNNQRRWCILAITIFAVSAVTAVVVVFAMREKWGAKSNPTGPYDYVSCLDLEPTTLSSDIPNFERLVAEIGMDGPRMLGGRDCSAVEEALLFVSQDYERWTADSRLNRFALATLFVSTGGKYWVNNTGWMTSEPECNWFGIDCRGGSVTGIKHENNEMRGTLPTELHRLDSLEKLVLRANELSGSIPSTIQSMTNLVHIDLYSNELGGNPLPFLVKMTWLEELYLQNNQGISGTIPTEIGNMGALEALDISFNAMDGEIPEALGEMNSLKLLRLGGNTHEGTIPASLSKLQRLRMLRIFHTSVVGSIPTELGNLVMLTDLTIRNSFLLSGSIPSELGRCTHLVKLDFNGQELLEGPLPSTLGQLTKLTFLDLLGTSVSGTLPLSLCSVIEFSNIRAPCTLDCRFCCRQPQC